LVLKEEEEATAAEEEEAREEEEEEEPVVRSGSFRFTSLQWCVFLCCSALSINPRSLIPNEILKKEGCRFGLRFVPIHTVQFFASGTETCGSPKSSNS
jgi:hypothetical protein